MTASDEGLEAVHGQALHRVVAALRLVQDRVPDTAAPTDVAQKVADLLERVAVLLEPHCAVISTDPDWDVNAIRRVTGRTISPELVDERWQVGRVDARITFTPFFHGANGAAHGGAIPLVIDALLGRLSSYSGAKCRTASLTVDYRRVTPVNRELRIAGWVDHVDGRKHYLNAAIYDGDEVTAEAHGLFIALRPGAL